MVGPERIVVTGESSIHTHADVQRMRDAGVRAFLVGEAFMRAEAGLAWPTCFPERLDTMDCCPCYDQLERRSADWLVAPGWQPLVDAFFASDAGCACRKFPDAFLRLRAGATIFPQPLHLLD